jgi:hypothetical protein
MKIGSLKKGIFCFSHASGPLQQKNKFTLNSNKFIENEADLYLVCILQKLTDSFESWHVGKYGVVHLQGTEIRPRNSILYDQTI